MGILRSGKRQKREIGILPVSARKERTIKVRTIKRTYPWAVGNLSLKNSVKRVRDGIRPSDRMKGVLSMKQEPPTLQRGEAVRSRSG